MYMRQKLSKKMLVLKFHPGMKCLHIFFFFSFRDGNFILGCNSSRNEIIPAYGEVFTRFRWDEKKKKRCVNSSFRDEILQ